MRRYIQNKFPGSGKCVHDVGHHPGEEASHHDPTELQDQQDDGDSISGRHLGWVYCHSHAAHPLLQYTHLQQRKEVIINSFI